MKKTICIVFIGILSGWIAPDVCAQCVTLSTGGDSVTEEGSVSYSLGQIILPSFEDGFLINSGVQQPYDMDNATHIQEEEIDDSFPIEIISDPLNDNVTIRKKSPDDRYLIRIYDANGSLLRKVEIYDMTTQISLSQGFYIITIQYDNHIIKRLKILKN